MTELCYQVKISKSAVARSGALLFSWHRGLALASQRVQRGGIAASARLGRRHSGGIGRPGKRDRRGALPQES
eukprot:12244272-Heterocapsa_arctica.AAC.1